MASKHTICGVTSSSTRFTNAKLSKRVSSRNVHRTRNAPQQGRNSRLICRAEATILGEVSNNLSQALELLQGVLNDPSSFELNQALGFVESQPVVDAALASAATLGAVGAANNLGSDNTEEACPTRYDVDALKAYWAKRPLASGSRSSAVISKIMSWAAKLLLDLQQGEEVTKRNAPARASEIRQIICDQGPAFVKVGQGVATRPDLLPPAYLKEMQKLLEQVSPFDSEEAKALLERDLGCPLYEVFEDVSAFDTPVAAASIGQVYKAKLRSNGQYVAVKCQRPNILESVTLDILTIRSVVEFFMAFPGESDFAQVCRQNATSLLAVLDASATRFLEELDFLQEAANGARFREELSQVASVRGIVKVPEVYLEYSTRHVLVQEWVDGVKLDKIQNDMTAEGATMRQDVVTKLLNAYMVQFLETGFLHADPHPGNFMLMEDGRLCIMDYGMMTEISEDQRYGFLEYMSHLSARQYDQTLADLVKLGFVPEELNNDPEKRAIVGPVIAETLEALYAQGGGMDKKVTILQEQEKSRMGEIAEKLDELQKDYPIVLPPYFVLILRAFGTLEGLGLAENSNFAILDECFPYIARRMLSDDNPRIREALKNFVYGGEEKLNIQRVESLANGFGSFTNSMDAEAAASTALVPTNQTSDRKPLDAATRDILSVVFDANGNYVQDLLVDEAVRAVDSLSRNGLVVVWKQLAQAAPLLTVGAFVPPPFPFAPPVALVPGLNVVPALSILASLRTDSIDLSDDDKENLAVLSKLAELMNTAISQSTTGQSTPQFNRADVDEALQVAETILPGAQRMSQRFAGLLFDRLRTRFQEDLQNISNGALQF